MATSARKVAKRVLIVLVAAVVVLIGAFAWYVNDYYRADEVALASVVDENGATDGVTVQQLAGDYVAFVPEDPIAGLVFYPGAKVQPEAYAPLLEQCAQRGIACVLVKPTFNLALLSVDAAADAQKQFPNIDTWVVAGHSMGGVAASNFAAQHPDAVDGVVYLAAYPDADLSDFDGAALSVLATNDTVLNRDSYAVAQDKLPQRARTVEIAGGNHAQYGNYGEQAGDGVAEISRESQQTQTVDEIDGFMQDIRTRI